MAKAKEAEQEQETGQEPAAEAEIKVEVKAPAPEPRIPVRVVGQKDGSALVEWIDEAAMYRRCYLPAGKVRDGAAGRRDLDKGIPYGLPWEAFIEIEATPEKVANELRRHGVWCWQDINHAALSAVNKAFDQGAFLRRVEQEVRK